MKILSTILLLIAVPVWAGDLTTGHQFSPAETVTHTTLNSAVEDAEINAGAVGTAEIADSAVTLPKLQGLKSVAGGRLTLAPGVPVTTSDVTAASTLYYTPYLHNEIGLYDGAKWLIKTFTERSIAVPAAANRNYDVYIYNNAGTITLDLTAWSNSGLAITAATNASPIVVTANSHGMANGDEVYINGVLGNTAANGTWIVSSVSTNTFALTGSTGNGSYTSGGWLNGRDVILARQDGVLVKSGSPTRRYIGTIRTVVSGQTEDSAKLRLVYNADNRVERSLAAIQTTGNHNYTTATWRESAAGSTLGETRFGLVLGLADRAIHIVNQGPVHNTTAGIGVAMGVGFDTSTTNSAQLSGSYGSPSGSMVSAHYRGVLPVGYHTVRRLEYSLATGLTTWGGLFSDFWSPGMVAIISM